MPISLRELYARKVSKDSETQSAINRALYEQEYTSGLITGSAVGSGAYRNQLLGITETPQDIVFDTADAPAPINSKVLGDDLETLFKFQNLDEGEVKILSKPYKELFNKLDKGSATDEDYEDLMGWVSSLQYGGAPKSTLEGIGKGLGQIGAAAGGLLASIGELLPGQESVYTSAYKMQKDLQADFDNQKKNLLTKIQQKGTWLQGKRLEDQQTELLSQGKLRRPDEMLFGDPYSPLNQIREFNKNFVPEKYGTNVLGKEAPITENPLTADPYKRSLAKAALKNLTPGTSLYELASNEMADRLIDASGEEFKQLFGKTGASTQKQILADGLNKKAAYYMKVYEKAQQENNTELLNEAKTAIEKIQNWYNLNAPEQKIETGFFNAGKRAVNTLMTVSSDAFKSTVRFFGKPLYSLMGVDTDKIRDYEGIVRSGETPIAVPMDINSDGKVNNLDVDYYGNPVFSGQFHYQGEKGEWKTNWASLPEVIAQVIGQMAPAIFMGGVFRSIGTAVLPEVAGGEIAAGVTSAGRLNLAQQGVAGLQALNKWKGLRLADRVSTLTTVAASTYDMMLQDELRFTTDVNAAKSRALGRSFIEGMTEALGVPEFGILSPGRYGVGLRAAVREVGLASMPRALTNTQLMSRVLGGIGTTGKRIAGQAISESLEEVVADFGNYLMTSYIKDSDKGYLKDDKFDAQSIMNTFTESLFSMIPFTGLTTSIQSINEYNSGQRLSMSQWVVANNPKSAVSYIRDQQIKGKLTEKEALRQVNEVNRLKDILGSMENIKSIKDLRTLLDDPDAQRRYFNLRVHQANLTDIDYDSLNEEERKVLNNYTLNEKINSKGKALLEQLENKRKELTPEELDTLTTLKAKKKKTEEEKAQEQELSQRGQLTKEEMFTYLELTRLSGMRNIDRSQLSAKDYKTLLDAKVITEEDLTPKKEDLEKQLKDTDEKLYKLKEVADKYESLTKEQKDEIVTNLFKEVIDETSQSNSPAELVQTINATRKQLDLIKNFNTLNSLDYDLRASLVEAATQRFEELVTKDESGINNFTRSLINEDVSNLSVGELQSRNAFMEYQAQEGYIDETSQKELTDKYLSQVYKQIIDFNKASEEEKVGMLVNYFDKVAALPESKNKQIFELPSLLADWSLQINGEDVGIEISEELFSAAQDKYYKLRNQNRAAGKSEASVSPATTTIVTAPADISTPTSPGVEAAQDYPTEESVYTSKLETIEQSQTKDFYSKYAEEILAGMKANNYTNVAKTLATTFANKINDFANVKKLGVRAPLETHKKITRLLEDVVNGKKDFNTAYAEALAILNAEFPENQDLNLIYRKATKLYMTVANVLSDYVDTTAEEMSSEEVEAAKKANVEMYDISTEVGTSPTEEVHDSIDLQKKEAALKVQEAQVMSWINPLRTAAFETNKEVVSEDPARVRNAEILNFVQENPNAERKIQVSSREFFYKQILKGQYSTFVERLEKAIKEKDTSEQTLNELQAFFGGNFFAVQPTATGAAELIYLIESGGEGLLKNPSAIVTFVINGELENFESENKAYPFYANLSLAKHLEKATEAVEGPQAREIPTIVSDYRQANPDAFRAAVESGLALVEGLRSQVSKDPSTPIVFDLDYITQGFRIGSKIIPLQEVEAPIEITFKSKKTNEDNGLLYPGVVGQAVGLINGQPYLLFNEFVERVGGLSEVEALAELIFNPETRSDFFDESRELIDYIANHYNIFQAGARKLEFSLKKGELEVFSVSIEKGKKKFTPITTPEEFISFMTKTDTPGIRYNVSQDAIRSNTRMFSIVDGKVTETPMSYNQFVRRTHKILFSEDPNFRNKQIVFNKQSLSEVVKPVIVNPPVAPTAPAPTTKKEDTWIFPEREKPAEEAKTSVIDYSSIAERILSYEDTEFLNAIKNDLETSNFLINVIGISADQNPVSLVKARVQKYLDKQKQAPVSTKKADKPVINIYWGSPESSTNTRVLSNLAPRKFTYQGKEYGSVEHAYQTLKSGNFDQATYDKYVKAGGYGTKIRGKAVQKGFDNLQLMRDLVVESFKQNPEQAKLLLNYSDFTHTTNEVIDKAFLDGIRLAQKNAELDALEGVKPEVKPTVSAKPSFSKETPFNTVVNTLNSVIKSMWEQMPKTRQGQVTTNPEGLVNYFVNFERNGIPIQGKIELIFIKINSEGKQVRIPMTEILEESWSPELKEVGKRPNGTPIFEEVGLETFPVDLTVLDWNNANFEVLFEENQVSSLPKNVLDVLDPKEFLGNLISQLSGEIVVPKAEPLVNPLAAAIMSQAKEPIAPESKIESVFTEDEVKEGEKLKENCVTPVAPPKAGKFKPMSGKTSKK